MFKNFAIPSLLLALVCSAQNVYQSNPLGYPLIQSPSGYLINVNLQGNFSTTSTPNNVYMIISLYSPQTLLMASPSSIDDPATDPSICGSFMQYNCSDNSVCSNIISIQPYIEYNLTYFAAGVGGPRSGLFTVPQVTASVGSGTISAGLVFNPAELVGSCQTSALPTLGEGTYGLIGLANTNNTPYNYAFYINKTSGNALVFQSNIDYHYASTSSPVISLPTSYTNWTITMPESNYLTLYVNQTSQNFLGKNITFDFNSNAIGLPTGMYSTVLSILSSTGITNCTGIYLPICSFSGNLASLSSMILEVGSQNITIPPEVYVKGYGGLSSPSPQITLNLKVIDSSYTGVNYVTEAFSVNTIILDSNFMKYYFTVFNGGNSTIDLYYAVDPLATIPGGSTNSSANVAAIVVACVFGVLFVILAIWFYVYRRNYKLVTGLGETQTDISMSNTTRAAFRP